MKKRKKYNGRRKSTRARYNYGEFLILLPCCAKEHQEELMATVSKAKRPAFVCGKEVPKDLFSISYGMLDELHDASSAQDPAAECLRIIMGLKPAEIYQLNACDVFGFMHFCREQIEKINKLFASLKVNYSSEELAAGVKDLEFGSFGVLDWYAKRMGITNQNEVRDVAWVRIYNCMKNDIEQNNYERRLHKQYMNQSKRK